MSRMSLNELKTKFEKMEENPKIGLGQGLNEILHGVEFQSINMATSCFYFDNLKQF